MAKKETTSKSTRTTSKKGHRSTVTGRFLKEGTTARNPRTTVSTSGAAFAAGLPDDPDEQKIERLAVEAEQGVPAEKLRRRGRPSIGEDASSSYSVRLPIDLVTLTDERSALDGVSRGETIRRALIEYLTK
ncbi:hypothetical protein [Mycolicibacterium pulveris]|uniref:hypothetical protein n=1 Tax=Mycolicibacterium pulveris TaxID=36813 RepID=UPI003CF2FD39